MGLELKEVACGLCGSLRSEPYLCRGDLQLFIPGNFCLVRCLDCGLVYLNPRPTAESVDSIYLPEYDQYTVGFEKDFKNPLRLMRFYGLKKRVRAIQKFKQNGRLLDVGCSTGDFLYVTREMTGWSVQGVEPNQFASQYARENLGLDVFTGELEQAPFAIESFDVVTLWNVLEHLRDPLSTLKKVSSLLKPDGLLVINTPNLDSLDAHVFGQYWIGFEIPRHFYVFSRKTLYKLLEKAGFKVVKTQCLYGSHAWAMSSLNFWFRSRKNLQGLSSLVEKVLFSLPVRIIFTPLFYCLDKLKLTTAPVDFCLKEGD